MGRIRFARDAKFSISTANDCARELNHGYVGTEHLLLGLLTTASELFPGEESVAELEDRVHKKVGPPSRRPRVTVKGDLPYTSIATAALARALAEAKSDGAAAVEAMHLLRGLVEDKGIAGKILRESGFQWEWALTSTQVEKSFDTAIALISIDDESEIPCYTQIVARVKECIAAGDFGPGDRLPPVRRLADHLDLAPGTVARAYALLEEEGVVDTNGPKGTTVASPKSSGRTAPSERVRELTGLLRPVVVAAYHLGGTAEDLLVALQVAIEGVFDDPLSDRI